MALSGQSAAQTLNDIIARRPVLEPVLRAFEPLLTVREELVRSLSGQLRAADLHLPAVEPERMTQGISLLAGADCQGLATYLAGSAAGLLPQLTQFTGLKAAVPALENFFADPPKPPLAEDHDPTGQDLRERLCSAVLASLDDPVKELATTLSLDAAVLKFAGEMVLSPVLRALTANARPVRGVDPWEEGNRWRQGYCPVCGSFPIIGWLDKATVKEDSPYLLAGGGKKHLYCGLCGASWSFRRNACPSCGAEGKGAVNILQQSDASHGERVDWCDKCKAYCPTVDLRTADAIPDMDAMALGMLHLDMVAAQKKLHPLKASFWNV